MAYGDATLQEPPVPWEEFKYPEYLSRLGDLLRERDRAFMRSCHPDAPGTVLSDADAEWRRPGPRHRRARAFPPGGSRVSRRDYARAESRIRESVILRRAGLDHTYAGREADLDTMRRHHARLGEIPPEMGFWAWWRRWVGGRR